MSTIGGRKRWLPGIKSASPDVASAARRMAINTVCQGSAADIVKHAMLRLEHELPLQVPGSAHMLLQVHDELVFRVRTRDLPRVASVVQTVMQRAAHADGLWDMTVPLPVKLEVGPSWGELREYTL